jgi:bifunctional ADP-heptose synthase (sugar kinase/adenylyltransferase)
VILTYERLDFILSRLPQIRIGLVGDLFLDRYFDIDSSLDEPSVETGLTAYQVTHVRNYPGALGTVLNNLVSLGVGKIVPITFVGEDGEGFELLKLLSKMPTVDLTHIHKTSSQRTPTYAKPMQFGKAVDRRERAELEVSELEVSELEASKPSLGVELNRLDFKNRTKTPANLENQITESIVAIENQIDAWIILDQVSEANCGVITENILSRLSSLARSKPDRFFLADSRERIQNFSAFSIKPNEREATSLSRGPDQTVFLTRGENGMTLHSPKQGMVEIPGIPVTGPIDICGAGDSCSAGIASAIATGASFSEAAMFGNLIASITIQQIGITGTASPEQIRKRFQEFSVRS